MLPAYEQLAAEVAAAAVAACREASTVAAGWTKEAMLTTTDAAGHVGRADTGTAAKAVYATEPVDRGSYVESLVASRDAPEKTNVIEEGRGAGKPVSVEGQSLIRRWVERKLGNVALLAAFPEAKATTRTNKKTGKTHVVKVTGISRDARERFLDGLAYIVTRKIREKGTPGIHPFGQARARLDGPEGAAIVEEVLARLLPKGGAA